jgi:iron(III) transport system substrate-binding protein
MKIVYGLLLFLLALALAATALLWQAPASPAQALVDNEIVFQYRGTDRDVRLAEKAKEEGRLVLYTSLAPTESTPLAEAFERKYGIRVELWRAISERVVQRVVAEARGQRYAVDVIETNGPEMEMLAREEVLAEFHSPYHADLPQEAVPSHRLWFPDRMNFFVVGFNTNMVQRSEIPATYDGFLDPKWKGRIGIEATDVEWMGTLIKTWGEARGMDYFRKLSAMKPDVRQGHVVLAELVAAGEVPVALTTYIANVEPLKRKGAPIDFVPVQPVVARPQGIGVARNAPHPHAALLFADLVLSLEGQQLFESMGRVPASTLVKSRLNDFPFTLIQPAMVLEEAPRWQQAWSKLFLTR